MDKKDFELICVTYLTGIIGNFELNLNFIRRTLQSVLPLPGSVAEDSFITFLEEKRAELQIPITTYLALFNQPNQDEHLAIVNLKLKEISKELTSKIEFMWEES